MGLGRLDGDGLLVEVRLGRPELGLELVELLLLTVDLVDELGELLPGLVEVLLGVGQRAGRERRQHDDGERRHGGARPGTC